MLSMQTTAEYKASMRPYAEVLIGGSDWIQIRFPMRILRNRFHSQ